MNDVSSLIDGTWQWSGWLDPKGRVRALFVLARLDAETLLIATTADPDALIDALRRFVFRSQVRIEVAGLQAVGQLASPGSTLGNALGRAHDGALELDMSGSGGERTLRLAEGSERATHPDPAREEAWWAFDIAHGWPALPGAPLGAWTPQQLSLQRLGAFSVRKGCYPGQEIVARTHFLGRVKRGLVRARGADLAAGCDVLDADGRVIGQIAAAAGGEALAVVPLDPPNASIFVGGSELEVVPLADGLQR